MNLETLLTILIVLIIGIILIKAVRKILSVILSLVLLYFAYYTFMTFPGAIKFAVFSQTFSFDSYRIETADYEKTGEYDFSSSPLEVGEHKVIGLSCEKHKPIVICEATILEESENE